MRRPVNDECPKCGSRIIAGMSKAHCSNQHCDHIEVMVKENTINTGDGDDG